jgi:serine/threonine protein kinase
MKGIYVCDMGIAKVKQVAERTMTSISKGPGTYPYMAPEMFRKGHRGPAVDIYSLGCLFIELFGGKRVWLDLDGPDIMLQILGSYNTPPKLPDMGHLKEPYIKGFASLMLKNVHRYMK